MEKRFIYFFVFFIGFCSAFSQFNQEFMVKLKVLEKRTNTPITDATVFVEGQVYTFSNVNDYYRIKVSKGDELIVSHSDFQTVYYTITSNEDIKIYVEQEAKQSYQQNIDSSKLYKKKDIDKSISFIEEILKGNPTKKQLAESYSVLADIYFYWKQYDLASENYTSSLLINQNSSVQLKLANTFFLLKQYAKSEEQYQLLLQKTLSPLQKIEVYRGLSSVYIKQKKYKKAQLRLEEALSIAKKNNFSTKITDINSDLGQVFVEEGQSEKASKYLKKSLELAQKETEKRSLKEEFKVADSYNKLSKYDDEIRLRQKTLKKAKKIASIKPEIINDTINLQKINYKIGNAYILKQRYDEAIPYLKKSIEEADANKDLEVKKYATRKLSEVYESVGEGNKALETYRIYVGLVDRLYIEKEQRIIQAERFSKRIAEKQNRIKSLEKDKKITKSKFNLTEEKSKRQQLIIYVLIFGVLLMGVMAYLFYRNIQQQKITNNLLALKSMRSQMNPHFIFNALNSVNSFIAVNDERNANRYLSEFSVLMRSVLENSDEDFIPLTKEIELLKLYTKLEYNRFKEKFDYSIEVDSSILLEDYQIPPMLLQPYVENSIWHGLRYKTEKGNLKILLNQKTKSSIEIIIQDDGIGRKKSQELKTENQLKQKSKGMSTVKNRISILNSMYKDKISVSISDVFSGGTGTKVSVIIRK